MAKKKAGRKEEKDCDERAGPTPAAEPAVPPPDNPMLRHREGMLRLGSDDEKEMAKARLEALKKTGRMPSSDDEE